MNGEIILFIIALTEACISPIPPDPFIIQMTLANVDLWVYYAVISTLGSTIGGAIGYGIGYAFMNVVKRYIKDSDYLKVRGLYDKYGWAAILIGGISSIPYKIFSITSGMLRFNAKRFIALSIIARGVRFFLVAYMTKEYGSSAINIITNILNGPEGLIIGIGVISAILALGVWNEMRNRER